MSLTLSREREEGTTKRRNRTSPFAALCYDVVNLISTFLPPFCCWRFSMVSRFTSKSVFLSMPNRSVGVHKLLDGLKKKFLLKGSQRDRKQDVYLCRFCNAIGNFCRGLRLQFPARRQTSLLHCCATCFTSYFLSSWPPLLQRCVAFLEKLRLLCLRGGILKCQFSNDFCRVAVIRGKATGSFFDKFDSPQWLAASPNDVLQLLSYSFASKCSDKTTVAVPGIRLFAEGGSAQPFILPKLETTTEWQSSEGLALLMFLHEKLVSAVAIFEQLQARKANVEEFLCLMPWDALLGGGLLFYFP